MTHVEHLKEIIAAWTSGDMDAVEAAIDRAVEHLDEDEPEPASGETEAPAPAESTPTPAVVSTTSRDAAAAFIALFNAAKRMLNQGPSASATAELEAAVAAAERFVR